jgi:molybdopterin molybdotransferase
MNSGNLARLATRNAAYNAASLRVDTALALILSQAAVLEGTETLPLAQGLERVLAADLASPIDVPGHDNAAMDGYALRGADLREDAPSRLRLAGAALAGRPYTGRVGAGQCVRITTGALMPEGADTVVVQEVVTLQGELVVVPAGQQPGANRRRAGEDVAAGGVALVAGALLRPGELGVAASLGLAGITVRRRPRVALLSTGDELLAAGAPPERGRVYDSNRAALAGLLARAGCEAMDLGIVADDAAALERALARAARDADAVISSGGVSIGDADYVRPLMEKLGEVLFWKLALKPGRPFAFGRLSRGSPATGAPDQYPPPGATPDGPLFFGLPGNPVAAMVTFYLLVRPALLAMQGRRDLEPPRLQAPTAHAMAKKAGRTEVLRGVLEQAQGRYGVRAAGAQGSGMLSSMARANCLVLLEHERGDVAEGEPVTVLPFEGLA